jgi:hypothetical protein
VYAVEATGITTTHNLVNKLTKEKGTHHASPLFVHKGERNTAYILGYTSDSYSSILSTNIQ